MQSRWMGFSGIVSFGWLGVYFRLASKEIPIDPIVSLFARLTCPIAILGSHFAIGMYWVLIANFATYALVGVAVETLRRQWNHSK